MVPFSFESITRSAALDTLKALPVSESARATHESFESHLERATASPPSPSTRGAARQDRPRERPASTSTEPTRNEPVRQTVQETRRDDDRVQEEEKVDAAEATKTAKPAAARDDEDVEQEPVTSDDVAASLAAQRADIQEIELNSSDESNNDSGDEEAATKPAEAASRAEESELVPALATNGEVPEKQQTIAIVDDTTQDRSATRSSGEAAENAESASLDQLVAATETNEEVTTSHIRDEGQIPETKLQEQEANPPRTAQHRRANRNDVAANQPPGETSVPASREAVAALVVAAADTASDDQSRQRRSHDGTDSRQPIGPTTAADEATMKTGTPTRFAEHLLSKTGDPNARGANLTDAGQARFVDRVARAVHAAGDRGGTLRLRLSPPELGSLTLELKVQGGAVTARVEADTPAARTLLLENLPLLRERLAELGMRVDQFDVDLTDRQPGGTPDGLQQNDQQQGDRPRSKHRSHKPEEAPRSKSQDTNTTIGNGGLNIIV